MGITVGIPQINLHPCMFQMRAVLDGALNPHWQQDAGNAVGNGGDKGNTSPVERMVSIQQLGDQIDWFRFLIPCGIHELHIAFNTDKTAINNVTQYCIKDDEILIVKGMQRLIISPVGKAVDAYCLTRRLATEQAYLRHNTLFCIITIVDPI